MLGWLIQDKESNVARDITLADAMPRAAVRASPIRLPAALLLAVSLGVVVRRLGVDWRWLPLAVLLVLDLGVASGLLLRGARRRVTGWFAVGGGHTVPSVGECSVEHRFEASGYHRHFPSVAAGAPVPGMDRRSRDEARDTNPQAAHDDGHGE